MSFKDFQPMFGQVKAEWLDTNSNEILPSFLFYVYALDPSRLRVLVTDFCSNSFEAIRSVLQLEDMQDNIGIGGSWSDFLGYMVASIRSQNAKLVLEGDSKSNAAVGAKFIAQKSKGMPRISIPLVTLINTAVDEAKSTLSFELYKTYERVHTLFVNEEERCLQLTKELTAEQGKNEALQKEVEMVLYSKRHKPHRPNAKASSDDFSGTSIQDSPVKQASQGLVSTKVTNRVAPAYRRAKARGVLLRDCEDDVES